MTDHGRTVLIRETEKLIEDAQYILQQLKNGADTVYTTSTTLCTMAMGEGFKFDVGDDPADQKRKFKLYQPICRRNSDKE